MRTAKFLPALLAGLGIVFAGHAHLAFGQTDLKGLPDSDFYHGNKVSGQVHNLYEQGLEYLTSTQNKDGSWPTSEGYGSDTAGVCAICVMAFMSSGEDPNFGKYSTQIRRGIRHLIMKQDPNSGLFRGNTYDFGFALLCLTEAYGVIDENSLWAGVPEEKRRSLAHAVEIGVRVAIVPKEKKFFGGDVPFFVRTQRRSHVYKVTYDRLWRQASP